MICSKHLEHCNIFFYAFCLKHLGAFIKVGFSMQDAKQGVYPSPSIRRLLPGYSESVRGISVFLHPLPFIRRPIPSCEDNLIWTDTW